MSATAARSVLARRVPRRFVVEPRTVPPHHVRALIVLGSVVGALAISAVLLLAGGHDPATIFVDVIDAGFGTELRLSQTLIATTPLILTGLAATVAYRMRVWTIGADGQLVVGAIAAAGVALLIGEGSSIVVVLPAAMVAGILGGAAWAAIAGVARAYLRTDEVISTLMLNFIAFQLMAYLVFGRETMWSDVSGPLPSGKILPEEARLPNLFASADVGIVVAIVVAIGVWAALRHTVWGYQVDVLGDSPRAGRYAGMNVPRMILGVMLVSGALAGLAGAVQVTTVTQALDPKALDPGLGLGYTGIVIAALARLNPLAVVPVALLMATLLNAGPAIALNGVPSSIVIILQGLILLLVAAGQFFVSYRIRRAARPGVEAAA